MSSNHIIRWTIALAALAPATLAQAEIVTAYDNFGSGNNGFQYNTGVSWMVAGSNSGFNIVQQAQRFEPSVSGELDTIYLGIGRVLSLSSVTIRLTSSQGNTPQTDGEILETWTFTSLPPLFQMPVAELTSVNRPFLDSSLSYWIWIESGLGTSVAWGHNVVGDSMFRNQFVSQGGPPGWNPGGFATGGAQRVDLLVLPAPDTCPADFNDDGIVNVSDLLILLGNWGDCMPPAPCIGDCTGDGEVNVQDLLCLLGQWGPCP